MMANPRPGDRAQCWYKSRTMPLHARLGIVVVAGRGRPRNHMVRLDDGALYVVPCGNLRPAPERIQGALF